ncbi:25267_t:CDS:2, partial [Gigaspora margarita]
IMGQKTKSSLVKAKLEFLTQKVVDLEENYLSLSREFIKLGHKHYIRCENITKNLDPKLGNFQYAYETNTSTTSVSIQNQLEIFVG